jgi:hypothetical protein
MANKTIYPGYPFQPLFDHMLQEHGLKLLESEMVNIVTLCDLLIKKDYYEKKQQAIALGLMQDGQQQPIKKTGAIWQQGEYDRLYDQLKADPERKIACWVDYTFKGELDYAPNLRDICSIFGKWLHFSSRGHTYGGAGTLLLGENEKEYFISECGRLNVAWLDESGETVQQLSEKVDMAHWELQSQKDAAKMFCDKYNMAATQLAETVDELKELTEKVDRFEKALKMIAMQKTCTEQEADEEMPIGSDGTRLGDIEYGYDHIINDAREVLGLPCRIMPKFKEVKP